MPLRQAFPTKQPSAPSNAQNQQQSSINEDAINGARVRIRPVGTIGNTDPTRIQELPNIEVTSPRARQPVTRDPRDPGTGGGRGPPPDSDTRLGPTGVRVVRVRPTNRPFRTENFTPVEFIPQQEATPPPVISRVRGRPIVPDDFPGNPLAIRGKTPLDEENNFQDVPTGPGQESSGNGNEFNGNRGRFSPPPSATGPSGTGGSNTRTRTRLRIVPTGNRARRPNPDNNNDPSEEPRATNLSGTRGGQAPANRIPFSSLGNEDSNDFDTTASGFPRRRLRPVNRLPQQVSREPSPPVRTLRPFTPKEVQTQPTPIPTRPPTTSEELVPTAPSVTREKSRVQDLLRQTLLSNAQTEGPSRNEEPSKTSGNIYFIAFYPRYFADLLKDSNKLVD